MFSTLRRFDSDHNDGRTHLRDIKLPITEDGYVSILVGMNVLTVHWIPKH